MKEQFADVPEVSPKNALIATDARGLRNAIRSIIYENFDDEAQTIARILETVRRFDRKSA